MRSQSEEIHVLKKTLESHQKEFEYRSSQLFKLQKDHKSLQVTIVLYHSLEDYQFILN